MVVAADYGDLGMLRMFGQPIKLGETPAVADRPANRFAEHADTILAGVAGYDPDRIAALRAAGVVP
jgi:crotonobetainyl-CoA:carnitine CoA-transferase CaiB-like acyl-CoA transferase